MRHETRPIFIAARNAKEVLKAVTDARSFFGSYDLARAQEEGREIGLTRMYQVSAPVNGQRRRAVRCE
jgi:hypothetical protein